MTTIAAGDPRERKQKLTGSRVFLHGVLIFLSILWLIPVAWTLYTSFRPYQDTAEARRAMQRHTGAS